MATRFVFTHRGHGDLSVTGDLHALAERRRAVTGTPPAPWVWLHQVHADGVVLADAPGHHAGATADAVITATPGVPVAVHTADCAPVLLEAPGAVAAVHAGWRGLLAGVVDRAVQAMTDAGHRPDRLLLGPTIRPRCYEFDAAALDPLVERFGASVRSTTSWRTPALDLGAAVASVAAGHGLSFDDVGTCTACSPNHWSHRARGDRERQALVAWLEP